MEQLCAKCYHFRNMKPSDSPIEYKGKMYKMLPSGHAAIVCAMADPIQCDKLKSSRSNFCHIHAAMQRDPSYTPRSYGREKPANGERYKTINDVRMVYDGRCWRRLCTNCNTKVGGSGDLCTRCVDRNEKI